MVLGVEMTAQRAPEHHRQHDRADRDVEAVKAGQHEERGTVHARGQPQTHLGPRVVILERLEAEEREAERDRDEEPQLERPAMARLERVMSAGEREAGGRQYHRIDILVTTLSYRRTIRGDG